MLTRLILLTWLTLFIFDAVTEKCLVVKMITFIDFI